LISTRFKIGWYLCFSFVGIYGEDSDIEKARYDLSKEESWKKIQEDLIRLKEETNG
jgi:hypothetical protein